MRIILIMLVCCGLVMFGVFRISNFFATGGGTKEKKPAEAPAKPVEAVRAAPVSKAAETPVAVPQDDPLPVYGPPPPPGYVPPSPPPAVAEAGEGFGKKKPVEIRVFRFVNRVVPSIDVLRAEIAVASDFSALIDERSNAWIVRAPADIMELYAKVVEALDVRPDQTDLDFLLVAVSQDRAAALGLSGLLSSGAPHLEGVSLAFEPNGLNFRAGGLSLNLDVDAGREAVHVVTLPVVRAVTGEPFKLDSVDEVPIARTAFRDDTEIRTYDYRKIGLGLSGRVQRVGPSYFLELKQSNGSVVRESPEAPTFRTSTTETSAWLLPDAWTVVSGLTMERRVWRRGFLERKDDQEKDLVLLFARARSALGVARVGDFVDVSTVLPDLEGGEHPLLPPKPRQASGKRSLEELEADFLRERKKKPRRVRLGPPHR